MPKFNTMKNAFSFYMDQNVVAFDQWLNTWFGGYADETFSSRCYRVRKENKFWKIMYHFVNSIFFLQENHCKTAYIRMRTNKYNPPLTAEEQLQLYYFETE